MCVCDSFGLTTLTTVGLGDIAPITPQGRLIVCGAILFGVAIIPAQTAKLVDIFVESQKDEEERRKKKRKGGKMASSSSALAEAIQSATDGMGPTGVAIEVPPRDKPGEPASSEKVCGRCNASPHRVDAAFCWSCGAEL